MDPMGTENDLSRENESSTSHASEEDDENASWSARILLRAARIEVFFEPPNLLMTGQHLFWEWKKWFFLEIEGVKREKSEHVIIGFLRGAGDSPNLPECSLRFPNLP